MIKHKKIIIFIFLIFYLFIFGIFSVNADVYYGYNANSTSNQIPYNTSVVISSGRVYMRFLDGNVYSLNTDTPSYFKHTFCVDSTISSWNSGGTPNAFKSVSFYKTDTKCYYPGSSYTGGRIMYLYGQTNVSYSCSVSLTNCTNGGWLYFNLDNQASWTLLQESYSMNSIDIDFNINQTNTYNSEISNNTNQTANNTYNSYKEQEETNDLITDSSIDTDNTSSSTTNWGNKNATNGTITNLLTLPISLLQAIVNGIQSSCSSFSLGSLFGTNISLPCINIGNLIGSGLWTTIDILFSGFMILAIAKKLIKIFNDFTNLKTNQVDELYGGDK